jgi:hypothetical protein
MRGDLEALSEEEIYTEIRISLPQYKKIVEKNSIF